ncbi:deazapurine DNA modification protein DpdA family protein [Azospirillum sp. sgz302134]
MTVEFILGLPGLSARALLDKARALDLPVMISANSLSRYTTVAGEPNRPDLKARKTPEEWEEFCENTRHRRWDGFDCRLLKNAHGLRCYLDSAGFVAMAKYRGYPWTVDDYMALAAAFPWERFSSMDLCVEPEVAADATAVRDRIAGTVNLNVECRRRAIDLGIIDRFMPVIQGHTPEDYLACAEKMPWIDASRTLGVGSMCRRSVHGPNGIVSVVSILDRQLPPGVRLHLFGLKSDGAHAVRGLEHRIASVDSQAYGVVARQAANRLREADPSFSKSNAFVADIMETWATRQVERLKQAGATFQDSLFLPAVERPPAEGSWAWAENLARERLRALVAAGELEHNDVNEAWVAQLAGDILSGDDTGVDDFWDGDDLAPDIPVARAA